jgi:hypothetical protein
VLNITSLTPFLVTPFWGCPSKVAVSLLILLMNRTLVVRLLWASQLVGLAALVLWTAADPALPTLLDRLINVPVTGLSETEWQVQFGQLRLVLVGVLGSVVACGFAGILIGMLGRSAERSSLKSLRGLIALTAIVALWCSFSIHRETVAWQGKRLRIAWKIGELEALAQPAADVLSDD